MNKWCYFNLLHPSDVLYFCRWYLVERWYAVEKLIISVRASRISDRCEVYRRAVAWAKGIRVIASHRNNRCIHTHMHAQEHAHTRKQALALELTQASISEPLPEPKVYKRIHTRTHAHTMSCIRIVAQHNVHMSLRIRVTVRCSIRLLVFQL